MKTLTSTLEAAQRSSSGSPYVAAVLADYDGYARRVRPRRVYTGAEEVLQHAAAVAGDGSLIRVRLQTAGTDTLYVSRVASPDAESDFSSWSALTTDISDVAGVAVAVLGSSVWVFCVEADDVSIRVFTSSDNGASFDGGAAVATAGAAVGSLAACAAADGDILAVWVESGTDVYRARFSSTWGTRTASSQTFHAVSGLALTYLLDWQVVITGQEVTTEEHRVWACRYGDGVNQTINTWGALREVTGAAAASGVSFASPSVGFLSVFRLYFVESYSGDEAYDRVQWTTLDLSHDFNEEQWREPAAFPYEDPYGLALAVVSGELWLTSPDGVWLSAVPGYAELDVSADVVKASVRVDADGAAVEVDLDNATGSYTAYGVGDLGALQRGGRLRLTPGYRTSAGAEIPTPYAYWVEAVELVTGARPVLRLRARDGWSLLQRWRARRQFAWAAGERLISQLLFFLLTRAGLEYGSLDSSDALTSLSPAYTVHPGESGVTAVQRLLSLVEDVAFWRGAELTTHLTVDDDTPSYAVGVEHALTQARYRADGPAVNRVRVVGLDVYGEATDFASSQATGEYIEQVIDINLTDSEDAVDRAVAVLRKAQLEARRDSLTLFGVHCGVELYDVVAVTDAQAGLDAKPSRVLGYEWRYEPSRARYDMTLTLGSV
jgi:hypothetical protein